VRENSTPAPAQRASERREPRGKGRDAATPSAVWRLTRRRPSVHLDRRVSRARARTSDVEGGMRGVLPLLAALAAHAGCTRTGGWHVIGAALPSALLSAWPASDVEVWFVGGDVGDGPLVLRLSDGRWQGVDTGTTGDLWWVWGEG